MSLLDKKTKIDDLLDRMAEEIQLDKTRYERMKGHYEAVKDWIEADELFFKPFKYDVYPHGSVRTQTTVKPIGKDEFDLDIALHIVTQWADHTPAKIYAELKRRLEEHETYKGMLETKNRCIRLNYSGDFHMDILPGIQESIHDEDKLRVPDRELGSWVSSNPRGYSKWFLNKANSVKLSLLEKAFSAENLPTDNFRNKKPLQRAVQLLKRYRDVYFQKDDSYKTSSIIITTIAGHFYDSEASIFETIDNIITKILQTIDNTPTRIKVVNPMNADEDFTDKWDNEPKYYEAFKAFCKYLHKEWQDLKIEHDMLQETRVMSNLFGEALYNKGRSLQDQFIKASANDSYAGLRKLAQPLSAAQKPYRL